MALPPTLRCLAAIVLALAACQGGPPHGAGPQAVGLPGNASGGGTTSAATGTEATASSSSSAGSTPLALRVLFIGNSYVYVNDLPTWVHRLAQSSGVATVDVDSVTLGGATLADQIAKTGAVDRIRKGGWTHVVLQGQSVEPLFDPVSFETAAEDLAAEAKKVGATPVFYETWARKAGDTVYQQPWSGGSPAAMQVGLREGYQKAATKTGGFVSPAGDAWETSLSKLLAINLFQPDGSHPLIQGTYLIACVFHAKLTGHSPVGVADHPAEISASDAAALQAIAAQTVGAAP